MKHWEHWKHLKKQSFEYIPLDVSCLHTHTKYQWANVFDFGNTFSYAMHVYCTLYIITEAVQCKTFHARVYAIFMFMEQQVRQLTALSFELTCEHTIG